ncbi:hypothetical protein EV644_12729 [Kribbella orskensis]|uniref:Uncharacterized protein n=1 Tax=Kribbella orskensis TaxID=2512216 RepID=A0ABY2B979_9ACTN|nr:hypothetical protein EV642_12829 [Kribbella sp. VKM Ac-2500]TCO12138.1 hypothetical protein EV644_12729 [Kribbella orskensis]
MSWFDICATMWDANSSGRFPRSSLNATNFRLDSLDSVIAS